MGAFADGSRAVALELRRDFFHLKKLSYECPLQGIAGQPDPSKHRSALVNILLY